MVTHYSVFLFTVEKKNVNHLIRRLLTFSIIQLLATRKKSDACKMFTQSPLADTYPTYMVKEKWHGHGELLADGFSSYKHQYIVENRFSFSDCMCVGECT